MNVAKSNSQISENNLSTPHKAYDMDKQKEVCFDTPLQLPDRWMMSVVLVEVYNTVHIITIRINRS